MMVGLSMHGAHGGELGGNATVRVTGRVYQRKNRGALRGRARKMLTSLGKRPCVVSQPADGTPRGVAAARKVVPGVSLDIGRIPVGRPYID